MHCLIKLSIVWLLVDSWLALPDCKFSHRRSIDWSVASNTKSICADHCLLHLHSRYLFLRIPKKHSLTTPKYLWPSIVLSRWHYQPETTKPPPTKAADKTIVQKISREESQFIEIYFVSRRKLNNSPRTWESSRGSIAKEISDDRNRFKIKTTHRMEQLDGGFGDEDRCFLFPSDSAKRTQFDHSRLFQSINRQTRKHNGRSNRK